MPACTIWLITAIKMMLTDLKIMLTDVKTMLTALKKDHFVKQQEHKFVLLLVLFTAVIMQHYNRFYQTKCKLYIPYCNYAINIKVNA